MWLFNFISSRFSFDLAWRAITLIVPIAAAVLAAAAAGTVAYKLGRAPVLVELAQLKASRATDGKAQADAQALRMSQAQAKGDALALALGNTVVQNLSLTSEISHAIKTATSGRACLNSRAISLLNQAPGVRIGAAADLPQPQRAATATSSTTSPDSEPDAAEQVITDTALAQWAAQAGGLYEQCRLRLDALIDWHAPINSSPGIPEHSRKN